MLPTGTKPDEMPAAGELTLKLTEFETEVGVSLSKYHVCTDSLAVVGLSNKAAGITPVNRVLLTKVVAKEVSLPFTDQATTL